MRTLLPMGGARLIGTAKKRARAIKEQRYKHLPTAEEGIMTFSPMRFKKLSSAKFFKALGTTQSGVSHIKFIF